MTSGNIIALILISGIILVALRSVKIGLFSLVPNLVPAIMGFGIWALVVGEINMAVAIVAAVSLGIIVDDKLSGTQAIKGKQFTYPPVRSNMQYNLLLGFLNYRL